MKTKSLLLMLFLMSASFMLEAQNLRVLTPSTSNISNDAALTLYNRLNQAVTLNGIASTNNSNKFLMIPSVLVTSIEATATTPINYLAELEITIYIVDNSKKLLFAQETLVKKGVGENATKAVMEAIKSLKARDPKLKKIITIAKNKIVEYYNTECDNVIKTINTYVEMEMYDEALNELNAVPQIDELNGCYDNTLNILRKISKEQQEISQTSIKNQNPDVSWINK